MTSNTQVGPGTVVRLAYEVFDADGDRVDGSEPAAPIEFVFGYGTLLPAIERAIEGLSAGDQRSLLLRPDAAYGRRDPRAVLELARDEFPEGVQPGDRFELENESGGLLVLKVLDVDDDRVVLDLNHPLAGQRVKIEVTVEDVRPATADELDRAERLLSAAQATEPEIGRSSSLGRFGPRSPALIPLERLLEGGCRRYEKPLASVHFRRKPPDPFGGAG